MVRSPSAFTRGADRVRGMRGGDKLVYKFQHHQWLTTAHFRLVQL